MNIAIYCSANDNIAGIYYSATRSLGEWMARNGHTLVWGGGKTGLMGCIGDSVKEAGGFTVGMVPKALETSGRVSEHINVYFACEGLSDRKELMIARSDVAIALPGGLGTLDEIFTQVGGNTIGFHRKKVILYNIGGFWDTTIALLDHLQATGMVRGDWRDMISVASTLDDIARLIG